ncbi:thiol-disulfide oxidoreductase DCC family protein [Sansalvadorimonas verongulae]|uniref:thiol-disulfide oxidoreductase DCC family protein n=1 Tax=Sansalvadorimonas verongulae TaxID=2172824 RepID=UPI0018AD1A29|nr:DUF393 domain-containing protein [Sansalvadorimonas verongulae]
MFKREDVRFPVTLFYDGGCPICMREINWLNRKDTRRRLRLVDINQEGFHQNYPDLEPAALDRLIHAKLGDGRIVTGMDATLAAWEAVGLGAWITPLRWPLLRPLADFGYRHFANNRHTLARRFAFLLGNPACPPKRD